MIKYIILAFVVIIALSFFGYDLKQIVEAPTTQNNLSYAWGGVVHVWSNYLKAPVIYVWNKIIVGILWEACINNLGRINNGAPTELQSAGERLMDTGERGYVPLGQ